MELVSDVPWSFWRKWLDDVNICSREETQGQGRLSQNYLQKFKQMPVPDWAQKMLYIIMPNRRSHLLSSFPLLVHDGYCLDHGLSGSCTKEMHAVRKLSVRYKPPSDFKLLSARKLKTLFQKQPSAHNRYSLLDRPRLCVNVFVESF